MTGKHLMIASIAAVALSAGALAGLDAGRNINSFYTAMREPAYRPIEPALQPASSWATENRTFAASPPPGTIWGQEVGRDERAFFDPSTSEVWREEPPVRVHRATVREVELPEPALVEPAPSEEPVDGWVDAPADPDRLPSAG
jgi:hypothetical protein